MLNKEPLYLQINRNLKKLIIDDNYAIGDKFLTERAICQNFEVSRATANKALSSLVSENILEFKRGIGTFIKTHPYSIGDYSLWQEPIALLNRNNVDYSIEIIPHAYSQKIDLQLERVIKISNSVIAIEELYIKNANFEKIEESDKKMSLYSIINNQNQIVGKDTTELIRSRYSTDEENILLEKNNKIPLLEIESSSEPKGSGTGFATKTIYIWDMVSIKFENQKNKLILNP